MMEQSRLEISAFIASLSASAAAAEKPTKMAAATTPAPAMAPAISAAETAPAAVSSAAAQLANFCAVSVAEATAAGAETLLDAAATSSAAAMEFGLADDAGISSAAAMISAADACNAIDPVSDINTEVNLAMESRAPSPVSAASTTPPGSGSPAPASPATEAVAAAAGDPHADSQQNSFRVPSKNEREVLQGPKTTGDVILSAEKTAQLPPRERTAGGENLEGSTPTPPQCEKRATLVNTSPQIAAAPFSPSTPSRRLEDVIAFGGINEKLTSPIRSSQRVRMQPNGNATQLDRATQLAKKRFHALTPGTKSNLSFSKFSDNEIAARATTLGVSLGSNTSEIEQSIVSLKQVEEDRRVTYLKNNLNENLGEETDCDILSTANQLC
jgi:hypothetical protein